MNRILLLPILMLAGCVTAIPNNSTVSDMLLHKVKANSKEVVKYEFESALPIDHTVSMGSLPASPSNANKFYGAMTKEYMDTKFVKQGDGGVLIKIKLESLSVDQEVAEGFLNKMATAVGSNGGGDATAKATMVSTVTVEKKGKVLGTKKVSASADENYKTGMAADMGRTYSDLLNKAANKSLLMTDSFLESLAL